MVQAALKGHTSCLKSLLDADADKDAKDSDRRTALMIAALNGHTACLKSLLDAGADKEAQNSDGETALIVAADNGHCSCVEALAQAGSKDVPDRYGTTVLMKGDNEQLKKKIAQTKSKASSLQHEVVDLTQLLTEKTQLLTTCEKSWNGAMMILPAVSIIFFCFLSSCGKENKEK